MPELEVNLLQGDTFRSASGPVWKDCPLQAIRDRYKSGLLEEDDFTTMTAAGTNAALSRYKVIGTTGTAVLLATNDGGAISILPGAGANQESYLTYGQGVGGMGEFLQNTPNKIWFEARVRIKELVNGGYFIGLAKPGDVASGFLANSTTQLSGSVNAVGFNVSYSGSPTALDIIYAAAAAQTTYKAAALALTANKWIKLGMRYDAQIANMLRFFINGAEVANTAGTFGVSVTASNFPNTVMMTPVFMAKNGSGSANELDVDWWRYAQIIEDTTYNAP